ncbi:MAG TPA: pilin [Burkholderiaceae bacterium]|jgi:type IV pilus assembly protein PilA|nr:pilin [Burkholderiaceae bacterium]
MKKNLFTHSDGFGFTIIEMMVVLAVISILSLLALPSFYFRQVQEQIQAITPLTTVAEAPVAAAWTLNQILPADNTAAGLPIANKMVGNYVSSVQIQNGAVNVTFGNRAANVLNGKILTFRPAVVSDSPIVPVTWVCGNAAAPKNMTIMGANQTNIAPNYLPPNCK